MHRYQARVRGDTFSDEVIAETPFNAAELFARKIHDEDSCLMEDGDTVIVEISATPTQWLSWESFEVGAIVTTKFDVNPLSN